MARMTKRLQPNNVIVYKFGKYEDTIAAEMETSDVRTVLKALADYEDLEEQCIAENQCDLKMLLFKWTEFFDDIAELYDYRAIGTVSEFRELKEKAIKKVEKCKDKYYCMCGCPVEIMLDGITLNPIGGQVYCDQCGAKLDWSEFVEKGE